MRPVHIAPDMILDFSKTTYDQCEGPRFDLEARLADVFGEIGLTACIVEEIECAAATDSDGHISMQEAFAVACTIIEILQGWMGEWLPVDKPEPKSKRIGMRSTPTQFEALKLAAKEAKMSVTDYLLWKAFCEPTKRV